MHRRLACSSPRRLPLATSLAPDARFGHARLAALALDRSGEHGRTNHRRRRRSEESEDVLRHRRDGRHVEDDQRRHDVHSALGHSADRLDRRHRDRAERSEDHSRSARARGTRATASRRDGASTSRSTAASPGSRSGLEKTQHIGRIVVHPTNPEHRLRRRGRRARGARIRSAACTRRSTAERPGS